MLLTKTPRWQDCGVSVAMATYNGIAYLPEQIDSLFRQTRLPDELVVYDDASTDATTELLRRIAVEAPFPVLVLQGVRNRGVNAAFESALQHCSGEVVFFCDQDDVWLPRKIETCLSALARSPEAGFAFCDASQFNSSVGTLNTSLWELARFSPRRQSAFGRDPLGTMLTGGNFVYGMASAFRQHVLRPFRPIDCDAAGMTHDTWFALHATALGVQGLAVPEKLVRYRRHGSQTSIVLGGGAADPQAFLRRAQARAASLIAALRNVRRNVEREALSMGCDASSSLALLDRKIAFLETREIQRRERSLARALRGLVDPDYWRLASGPASVVRDYRGVW
jgi:hypothetical protein